MPETYCESAVVLNRRFFRNYDYLVSLYTRGRGKIEIVARGALRPQSRLAAHLEPLTLVDVMVVNGRLSTVGGAVSQDCYPHCKADLEKIIVAGQAIGMINRWLGEHISDERIFNLINDFLTILNKHVADQDWYEWLSHIFLYQVLGCLGYYLELDVCQKCGKAINATATLDVHHQGLICQSCVTNNQNVVTVEQREQLQLYRKKSLLVLSTTITYRQEIKAITTLLQSWLRYMNEELTHYQKRN